MVFTKQQQQRQQQHLCDQIIINPKEFCYKWYSRNNSSSDNNTNNDNNNLTLSHEPDVPEGPRDGLW